MKLKNIIKSLSMILAFLVIIVALPINVIAASPEKHETGYNEEIATDTQEEQSPTETADETDEGDNTDEEEQGEFETEVFHYEYEIEDTAMSAPPMTQIGDVADPCAPAILQDGVYAIENVGNDNFYMSVEGGYAVAGYNIVQQNYSSNTPLTDFSRVSLFKVSQVGTNRYIIRSMLNNRISPVRGTGTDVNKLETGYIDPDDSVLGTTYTIMYLGGAYIIQPYGSTDVVAAPNTTVSGSSNSTESQLILTSLSAAGTRGKWKFTAYTGDTRYGFVGTQPVDMDNGLIKGESSTIYLKSWSTVINANTPYLTIAPLCLDIAKSTWSSSNFSAQIKAKKCGDFEIKCEIRSGSLQTATHTWERTYTVIPDIVGDTAFIQNGATGKYIEVENGSTSNGGIVQQNDFIAHPKMRWQFELGGGGYFKIKSVNSGKYLGVDSANIAKVKQYSSITDYTLWKLTEITNCTYKISCKASALNGKVLSMPDSTSGNAVDLTTLSYTNDSDYRDVWEFIIYLGEVQYWSSDSNTVSYWETPPTIYVEDRVNNTDFKFQAAVDTAIAEWSDALNISFTTASAANADIKIYGMTPEQFEEHTGDDYPPYRAGLTKNDFSETICCVVYNAELKIITKINSSEVFLIYDPSFELTISQTKSVATHELGHALGYTGHSFDGNDVMYPDVRSHFWLTTNDINHLAQIYALMY